jgi:predicted amidohydrolase
MTKIGTLKVALAQTKANIDSKQEVIDGINKILLESKATSYDLICFPELFASKINLCNLDKTSEAADGYLYNALSDIAVRYGAYVAGGILEKEEDNYYNTALLIDSNGDLLGKHRKICLNKFEEQFLCQGNKISVFDTPIGRLGLVIGNDIHSLLICEKLAVEEVDIIICLSQVPFEYSCIVENVALSRIMDIPCYLLLSTIVGTSSISRLEFYGLTSAMLNTNLLEDNICVKAEHFIMGRLNHEETGLLSVEIDVDKLKNDREQSTNKIQHMQVRELLKMLESPVNE